MMRYFLIFLLLISFRNACDASLLESVLTEGVTIDLREPTISNGEIRTSRGGVITGPGIRLQARRINYTRQTLTHRVVAEGDVICEYGSDIIVGDKIEYDFLTKTGIIENGRGIMYPWYFGGERVALCSDGTYKMRAAYFTTSEDIKNDWQILAEEATITNGCYLSAKNLQIRIFNKTIFQMPCFNINLDFIFDTPIRYYIGVGGTRGTRFGIQYDLFRWGCWKTYLRLDYRLFRGPGGGFEVHYKSPDQRERFDMINYAARDNSISNLSQRFRYRFQGSYCNFLLNEKVSINLNYDKLSDKDMATDYEDIKLKIAIAERTQLIIRRQDFFWLTNLITRPRVNTFQTLKQELPTIETNIRPLTLGNTSIIINNDFRASYLDFDYTNKLPNVRDYSSMRVQYITQLYRPFSHKYVTFTPQIGGLAIYYQNSPELKPQFLAAGLFDAELNTYFHRYYQASKHQIKPYIKYSYYTFPTSKPNQHYIFDIEDGWYRLNTLRFGVLQNIYDKEVGGCIFRNFMLDVYAYAFIDTKTIDLPVPRAYADLCYQYSPRVRNTIESAWDFQRNQIAHLNWRLDWTLDDDFAIAAEYRHRNAWDWRKVDYFNFILDSYRSEEELRHSSLSDRRDTILVHLYYRFHPCWVLEFSSRQGWNREIEPKYIEYEVDLMGTIRSSWNLRFTYQHLEHDDRFAFSFSLGMKRPSEKRFRNLPPCVEF